MRTEKNITSITDSEIWLGNCPSKNPLFWMRFNSFLYSFLFNTWVAPKQNRKLHVGSLKILSYASLLFTKTDRPCSQVTQLRVTVLRGKDFYFIQLSLSVSEASKVIRYVCDLSSAWRGLGCYRKWFTLLIIQTYIKMIQWPCCDAISFHRPQKKPRWIAEIGYIRSINHIPKVLETL